jgi:hypothetical protein
MQQRQYVGIDLHRRRSVIVRMAEDGQVPGVDQVVNDPVEFAMAVAKAGPDPEVALEATYGWYWAADLLQANGAKVHLVHPLGLHWDSRRVKTTCGTRPSWRTGCAAGTCPRRSFVDEGLELLTEDQARGLLATGEVGRPIWSGVGGDSRLYPLRRNPAHHDVCHKDWTFASTPTSDPVAQ